ncbi:hypothetical protein [Sphingomonas sp. LHG3443-2]|uniref:hypothetical protein n=1 Tax=Sphingomonas sp. LHG3443-2 TaxID=2804639 RepID=UPI003CF38147
MNMTTLMVATAATTLSACAVKQPANEPAAPPATTPGERRGGEQIERSPTQPPAEIDPPHVDPGPRVPPPPGNEAAPSS